MNRHFPSLAQLYSPSAAEVAAQLPAVGEGMASTLKALADDPRPDRITMAAAQLRGAGVLLNRLREALQREAPKGEQ